MSPPPKPRRELFPLYKGNKLGSPRNNQGAFSNCHNKQDMVSWLMKEDLPSLSLDTKDGLDNQTGPSPSLPCLVPVPWHFISARWQGVTLASAELVGLPQTQCLTVETFSSFPALRSTERGRLPQPGFLTSSVHCDLEKRALQMGD